MLTLTRQMPTTAVYTCMIVPLTCSALAFESIPGKLAAVAWAMATALYLMLMPALSLFGKPRVLIPPQYRSTPVAPSRT
jgi:hypothetical protein